MKARKFAFSSTFSGGPRLDLLPDDGVAGQAVGRLLGPIGGDRDLRGRSPRARSSPCSGDVSSRRSSIITLASSRATSQRIDVARGLCARRPRAGPGWRPRGSLQQLDHALALGAGAIIRRWTMTVSVSTPAVGRLGVQVLTDYHLHLRPDEDDTPPERYFTAENVERYLEAAAAAAGIEEIGVSEHVHRFSQALELWRHPFWEEQALDDLDAYCEFVRGRRCGWGSSATSCPAPRTAPPPCSRPPLRLRGRLGPLHRRGRRRPRGLGRLGAAGDPDEVWRRYFEALAECARSGLFDILAHPDLVKVWGAPGRSRSRSPPLLRAGGRGDR